MGVRGFTMPIMPNAYWPHDRPLVLVAFPSHGLVGPIAANFLVQSLNMQLVATMESPHFPPVATIQDGRALPPVQFYAAKRDCFDGRAGEIIVVRSDVPVPSQHAAEIATEVLAWAKSVGSQLILLIEGAPGPNIGTDVYAVPNTAGQPEVGPLGAKQPPEGAIGGFPAALLVQGDKAQLPVVCLFTGATQGSPDAAAAARLVEVVDTLVPGITMDHTAILQRATDLEGALKDELAKRAQPAAAATGGDDVAYH